MLDHHDAQRFQAWRVGDGVSQVNRAKIVDYVSRQLPSRCSGIAVNGDVIGLSQRRIETFGAVDDKKRSGDGFLIILMCITVK